jgi:hypothetical protein
MTYPLLFDSGNFTQRFAGECDGSHAGAEITTLA